MLEKAIEKKVIEFARRHGWANLKLSGPNDRGKPDRLFLKNGRAVFVEFKTAGRKPTKKQQYEIEQLQKNGFAVFVVDSVELGKSLITDEFPHDRQ